MSHSRAMELHTLRCPSCSSTDVQPCEGSSTQYECEHCGSQFLAKAGQKKPPQTSSSSSTGIIVILVVVGLLIAVMGIGAAGWLLVAVEEPPPVESRGKSVAVEVSPSMRKQAPAPKKPVVKIERHVKGQTMIGGQFWLITYKNVGETPIHRPAAVVSLFDAGGARVGEQSGWAKRDTLAPGASVVILVSVSKPPSYHRVVVAARAPEPVTRTSEVGLEVKAFDVQTETIGKKLVGTVKNNQEKKVRFVQVVAVGRDDQNQAVSLGSAYATSKSLAPNEESGFKVRIGTWQIAEAKTYEVYAIGKVY